MKSRTPKQNRTSLCSMTDIGLPDIDGGGR